MRPTDKETDKARPTGRLTGEEVANAKVNMAILLVDVAHGMLLDADGALIRYGRTLRHESKRDWGFLMKAWSTLKYWVKRCASPIYNCDDSEYCIQDSDDWQEIIELIADRIGDDAAKRKKLITYLHKFKSIYGIVP